MLSTQVLQVTGVGPMQVGSFLTSPLGILAVLVVLAVVVLVGRFVLKVAWRLVVIGIIVVATLYILGLLGFSVL
ncbi:MAG: hypothetical protein V5A44_07145 [Haloarculaceae archaeon]